MTFQKSKLSLITLWQEQFDLATNCHAAILLEDEQGLLLIEKTNPYFPYQATKFASRNQVNEYMIDTLSVHYEELKYPIPVMVVMKNDQAILPLKGNE